MPSALFFISLSETSVYINAPMTTRKTMLWNDGVHEDILVEIFSSGVNVDVGALMSGLQVKGYTFTENALR